VHVRSVDPYLRCARKVTHARFDGDTQHTGQDSAVRIILDYEIFLKKKRAVFLFSVFGNPLFGILDFSLAFTFDLDVALHF
jgi:hypothetical protein